MSNIIEMSNSDFDVYRNHFSSQVTGIILPEDMNPALSFSILSRIDIVYSQLRLDLSILESRKDYYSKKINRLEKVIGEGKSEKDRYRDAVHKLENYQETSENTVNLYNIYSNIYERYLIVKGFVDILENKQKKMITYNGIMKLDNQLSGIYES